MLFNSFAYLIFLPVVFTMFWALQDKYRWLLLLISSYVFYMVSGPVYAILLLGITAVSFFVALWIEKDPGHKRALLVLAVVICIGLLFLFKYLIFLYTMLCDIERLFGIQEDPIVFNIVLPVGISFYTFQSIGYVIDVYRGDIIAERHFGKYAAFVSFFPQLVAGPIERSGHLLTQINRKKIFNSEKAMYGMKLMLWGYYKKLVIADVISPYVQTVFDNPRAYNGLTLLIAALLFSIQIYCDFSGYSDIAIGTAKLFDIDLMTNFKSPYYSASIREFWSRWHISLSTWFRDYVYIPMGGSRAGKLRNVFNLMVTFLVSGLWHGAAWNFVVWGGGHGIAQIAERTAFGKTKQPKNVLYRIIRTTIVFLFCTYAWVFFVSKSVTDAIYVVQSSVVGISHPVQYLSSGISGLYRIGLSWSILGLLCICLVILAVYDGIAYVEDDFILWISGKKKVVQWGFYVFLVLFVIFFSKKGVAADFIYFQF